MLSAELHSSSLNEVQAARPATVRTQQPYVHETVEQQNQVTMTGGTQMPLTGHIGDGCEATEATT